MYNVHTLYMSPPSSFCENCGNTPSEKADFACASGEVKIKLNKHTNMYMSDCTCTHTRGHFPAESAPHSVLCFVLHPAIMLGYFLQYFTVSIRFHVIGRHRPFGSANSNKNVPTCTYLPTQIMWSTSITHKKNKGGLQSSWQLRVFFHNAIISHYYY